VYGKREAREIGKNYTTLRNISHFKKGQRGGRQQKRREPPPTHTPCTNMEEENLQEFEVQYSFILWIGDFSCFARTNFCEWG